jgi:hypothetical protein
MRLLIIPWNYYNSSGGSIHSRLQRFSNILKSQLVYIWFAVHTVSAQPHESAFREIQAFLLPEKFEKSTFISSSQGITTLAAWSPRRHDILLALFNPFQSSIKYRYKYTAFGFDDLYTADFNEDGSPDLVLVNIQEQTIASVLHLSKDSLQVGYKTKIPFAPEKILIGDYNNDKHLDLLVYGHTAPGILPLIGNGKGRFLPGALIAPDNAVGAVDLAQVNNDNLIDLIIWDWVKSELHILYGVGRGKFIDQSVFPVQGDVEFLRTASIVRGHPLDLILRMTNPPGFQIWEGNDYGDLQLKNRLSIEGKLSDFALTDINNDGISDILATVNPASLLVFLNNDEDPFSDRVEYASGDNPQNIFILSPQSGNPKDCIVFDRGLGQFLVYRNAAKPCFMKDSVQLVTGVFPTEIVAHDFNRDNISDIALINAKSQSVSLFFGEKASAPFGPLSFSLTEKPNHLTYHSTSDSTVQFVLTFPQTQQISYFTIDPANSSASNAVIGCEGDAQIVESTLNNRHEAEFVTWNTTIPGGNSLSFYEQLAPTTFIERTFRLPSPDVLLGASVADLNKDSLQDIIYAYRAGDTAAVELGIAFGDSLYSMKHRIVSRELLLPDVKIIFIWLADFDNDGVMDILLQTGLPDRQLMALKGKEGGYYADPKIIANGLAIVDRSDIQIVDVDGDGYPDLVADLESLGRVLWFRNGGQLNFNAEKSLWTEHGLSHFVIADVNADGVNDLLMTFSKKGTLKIINGTQLDFHKREKLGEANSRNP